MFTFPIPYSSTNTSFSFPWYYDYFYEKRLEPMKVEYVFINTNTLNKQEDKTLKVEVLSFDEMMQRTFNSIFSNKQFPKYNLLVNSENEEAILELAVAGYTKDSVKLSEEEGEDGITRVYVELLESKRNNEKFVSVAGNMKSGKVFFGFALPKYLEVTDAKLVDGVLRIFIKNNVPQEKRKREIVVK